MKLYRYIQKTCCFYASDWHLTVMLLPFISKKLEEKCSIYMKCESNIEEKMEILLNKLNVRNKEKILKIIWNNMVAEEPYDDCEKIYIVSGSIEHINVTNKIIEGYYEHRNDLVKIINCYEVGKNENLNKIIEENGYTQILNTKGEHSLI